MRVLEEEIADIAQDDHQLESAAPAPTPAAVQAPPQAIERPEAPTPALGRPMAAAELAAPTPQQQEQQALDAMSPALAPLECLRAC